MWYSIMCIWSQTSLSPPLVPDLPLPSLVPDLPLSFLGTRPPPLLPWYRRMEVLEHRTDFAAQSDAYEKYAALARKKVRATCKRDNIFSANWCLK